MADAPINDPGKQTYVRRLPTAFDLFINAITGGQLDETISSRCSKGALAGNWFAKFMVWWLDLIQPDHLQKAPEGDEVRAQEAVADLEKNTGTTPPTFQK
jgi:hypothetical protein